MKKKELQEIFALLDEAGVKYELCDTPTPVSLTSVPCGPRTNIFLINNIGLHGFQSC